MKSKKCDTKVNSKDFIGRKRSNSRNKSRNKTKSSGHPNVDHKDVNINALDNDPSWYNVYPELVDSTARISTGYPIGINYDITGSSERNWNFVNSIHTMRLRYTHGIGLTESDRDPVNLAATKLYSFVRHANSGHSNYERTDLMLYFLSVIEAYNLIAVAIRAYGAINMFNNMNRAMPKYVVEAMGWDYDDLVGEAAILRTRINNAIARVNSLYVPTELNVAKRWWWLNTTCFTDSAGPKAMNYIFTPTHYRVWEEMDSDNGGYLKAYELSDTLTVSAWSQAINRVLDHLLDSEDLGIMSGDILKAYGDKVFTLSMIEENYTTPFVFSEEVLMQINNTHFTGRSLMSVDITQETNANLNSGLRYMPRVAIDASNTTDILYVNSMRMTPIMSFPVENPDNSMVMVASRNMTYGDDYYDDEGYLSLSCGSEVMVDCYIYAGDYPIKMNPSFAEFHDTVADYLKLIRFDYCPMVIAVNRDAVNPDVYAACSHYENVIPVDERTLARMHDTALLSLFSALV
nr:putative capsid protein [Picobirnavirus sp.]